MTSMRTISRLLVLAALFTMGACDQLNRPLNNTPSSSVSPARPPADPDAGPMNPANAEDAAPVAPAISAEPGDVRL